MSDGIEIHFDERRGYLELACEPATFASYRALVRQQLADFPEIAVEKVHEIHIVESETSVARLAAPRKRIPGIVTALLTAVVIGLAVIGAFALLSAIAS